MQIKKINAFEPLRLIAAIFIVLHHAEIVLYKVPDLVAQENLHFQASYLTVEFFFLLSGFLLTMSIERRRLHGNANNRELFLGIVNSRIKTLLPPVVSAITFGLIVNIIILGVSTLKSTIVNIVPNLLFMGTTVSDAVQGNGSWYVTVLFWISLIFAYLIVYHYDAALIVVPLISVFAYMIMFRINGSLPAHNEPILFGWLSMGWFRGFLGLSIGILLYRCASTKLFTNVAGKISKACLYGLFGFALIGWAYLLINRFGGKVDFVCYPVFALTIFTLVGLSQKTQRDSSDWLSAAICANSYSLYLIHPTVILIFTRMRYMDFSKTTVMVAIVVVSYIVSYLLHLFTKKVGGAFFLWIAKLAP